MDTKLCPYCGEEIRAAAIRCRYCRSRLASFAIERWHRSHPEARLTGVCAALAHAFAVPVTLVRVAFVVLTLALPGRLFAPALYLALWLVIPQRPGGESLLEQAFRRGLAIAGWLSGRSGPPGSSLIQS